MKRILLVVLLVGMGCQSHAPESRKVTYMVGGTAKSAGLTYRNQSGGIEQKAATIPWELEFQARPGTLVQLSAQKKQEKGTIEVAIWTAGRRIQSATSDEAYGIASVNGIVP